MQLLKATTTTTTTMMTCHLQNGASCCHRKKRDAKIIQIYYKASRFWKERLYFVITVGGKIFQVQVNVRLRVTRDSLIIRSSFVISLFSRAAKFGKKWTKNKIARLIIPFLSAAAWIMQDSCSRRWVYVGIMVEALRKDFERRSEPLVNDVSATGRTVLLTFAYQSRHRQKKVFCKFAFFLSRMKSSECPWTVQAKLIITKICSSNICFPFLISPSSSSKFTEKRQKLLHSLTRRHHISSSRTTKRAKQSDMFCTIVTNEPTY